MSIQTIEIRTSRSGLQKKIDVVQNDSGRTLGCIVSDMKIPESSNARIYAVKPSGAKVYNDCTIEKSMVLVSLTTQMLAETGVVYCQIEITASGKTVTSFEFSIHVLKQLKDSTAIESTDEFTALEVALEEAKSLSHPEFVVSSVRQNLVSGESVQVLFGKIKRWFTDLGTSAFKGVSNVLTTTSEGYVLDARQGKALSDKIGNLSSLETTAKTSSVDAINELNRKLEWTHTSFPDSTYMSVRPDVPLKVIKIGRVCMVSGEIIAQQTWTGSSKTTRLILPKPANSITTTCSTYYNDRFTSKAIITTDGVLRFQNGVEGTQYSLCITYLTAE